MKFYFDANSKKGITYTPDWIKFTTKEGKEITFDIRGEIDFSKDSLHGRCKGELILWTVDDKDFGDEFDFFDDEELEKLVHEHFYKKLETGTNFIVGIYPASDDCDTLKKCEDDTIEEGSGTIEIFFDGQEHCFEFKFETEINL